MINGRLSYNDENERFGILSAGKWKDDGLHCGETFEVLIDGEWKPDRIEMLFGGEWYLVYSKLRGSDLESLQVRIK